MLQLVYSYYFIISAALGLRQRMAFLLLTGATGLLGRYLMRDLLSADDGQQVAVVVRPSRMETSLQRVEAAMQKWDSELGRCLPRPVILEGDISQPGLGLSDAQRRWVARHCDGVLHNAASLTFHADSGKKGEPWTSNVDGTRHVLEVCHEAGIQRFFHVSTAYVCGLRQGRVLEGELDIGQELGNDYEQSKVAAEKMVRDAGFAHPPTVFRPSIIVGDSRTGYTSTFHGFYAPLQLAHAVAGRINNIEPSELRFLARLNLNGDETKNFVPVDWVSAVMCKVIRAPSLHGRTFHLTSPEPITVEFTQEAILAAVAHLLSGESKAPPPSDSTDLETMFRTRMTIYESYWRNDPTFDRTNTNAATADLPCPILDSPTLSRLTQFAVKTQFGWPKPRPAVPLCDVHSWLTSALPERTSEVESATAPDDCLVLQVSGSGGGVWTLTVEEAIRANGWFVGDVAGCKAVCRLNTATFVRLAGGKLSIQDALDLGRVMIEGKGPVLQNIVTLLQNFFIARSTNLLPASQTERALPRPLATL